MYFSIVIYMNCIILILNLIVYLLVCFFDDFMFLMNVIRKNFYEWRILLINVLFNNNEK